jgi:DNA-binding NtrC family response regulator
MLVASFFRDLLGDPNASPSSEMVRTMMCSTWPGNVRELRSAVERSLVGAPLTLEEDAVAGGAANGISFRTAKSLAAAAWEKRYLAELLPAHDGNVSKAARAAKMNRSHLSELVRRHGLADIRAVLNDDAPADD